MSWFSWNPTKIFAIIRPRGEPMEIQPVCLYITLLKLNSNREQANFNSSSNTFEFICIGASPWLTNCLTQSCVLSVIGKLVNKDLISNEHIFVISCLIFNWLTSLANENESFVLWFECTTSIDLNICTHQLVLVCTIWPACVGGICHSYYGSEGYVRSMNFR